ncbi:MAG: DUF3108 domain-containing protein [Bacteroidota bacterium]|nr:DUF3108 domain-containing protein [Bacteroidota bacterium]
MKLVFLFIVAVFNIIPGWFPLSPYDFGDSRYSQTISHNSVFQVGEELTYNVSYLGIDIGHVRIKQVENTDKGRVGYKAIAYIDSYKGIPFVDLHAVFESNIHPAIYSNQFFAREKENGNWKAYFYDFDYPKRKMYIEESIWKSGKVNKRDTIVIDTFQQDGLSIFFYARRNALTPQQKHVPVIVNEKKWNTYINFTGSQVKGEIDAVNYPIDLVYLVGEADFTGVFGLTGGFEGWFSRDAACVPIMANMKVLIGKIHIELMSWKRDGWSPPRFADNEKD